MISVQSIIFRQPLDLEASDTWAELTRGTERSRENGAHLTSMGYITNVLGWRNSGLGVSHTHVHSALIELCR